MVSKAKRSPKPMTDIVVDQKLESKTKKETMIQVGDQGWRHLVSEKKE
jgi:hypothetical protein